MKKHSTKPAKNPKPIIPAFLTPLDGREEFTRDARGSDRSAPASGAATPEVPTPPEGSTAAAGSQLAAAGDGRTPTESPSPPQPTPEELQAKFESEFRPFQRRIFQDQTTGILILYWARQVGKTHVLAAWAVQRLLRHPGRLVVVLSNSKENGAEFAQKCADLTVRMGALPEMEDLSPDLSYRNMRYEVRITVQGKVGRIKVLASNPRTARGFSGDLILDEFAFHEDSAAIWGAAEPFFSSNRDYLCRISSTGNGRHNAFYRLASGSSRALSSTSSSTLSNQPRDKVNEIVSRSSSSSSSVPVHRVNAEPEPCAPNSNTPHAPDPPRSEGSAPSCSSSSSSSSSVPIPGTNAEPELCAPNSSTPNASAALRPDEIMGVLDSIAKGQLNSFGSYYLAASGYTVSCVSRSAAHIMGVPVFDPATRAEITPEQARARALDKHTYDQNYECIFADENMTLLSHELISAAERSPICIDDQAWSSESISRMALARGDLQVGNDIGRNRDLSVVTVIERDGDLRRVIAMLRMQNMRLPDQQKQLDIVCRMTKFKSYCGDITGLGVGLVEYLQQRWGTSRIHGVNFATTEPITEEIANEGRKHTTARVTEIMAMNLLALFEDRRIEIPNDAQLRDDLRKPERVTSPGGRVSIAATRDKAGHADGFWSLALAVRAGEKARVPFQYERLPVPEHMKLSERLFMCSTLQEYWRDDRRF
jgi:phage FluMu gp28-like protein